MPRMLRILAFAFLLPSVFLIQPAEAALELDIACEGTESTGGGSRTYQYTLVNTGATAVTLTLFYLGTMDLNLASYTNWVAPASFTATVSDWATLTGLYGTSIMATTLVKTPHGTLPPQITYPTPGGVLWNGSIILAPAQTVTFGFNHPHTSVDVEWLAEHPNAANLSQGFLTNAMAGPLGVFTQGYVHGPGNDPTPIQETTWGRIKALYN